MIKVKVEMLLEGDLPYTLRTVRVFGIKVYEKRLESRPGSEQWFT